RDVVPDLCISPSFPTRRSSDLPSPCITPSTETFVMVVSFMVAVSFSMSLSLVGCSTRSQRPPLDLAPDSFFGEDGIDLADGLAQDRKSTRLNSSHQIMSYAVFC